MDGMTNEQITAELEELFGSSTPDEEPVAEEQIDETEEEETTDESAEVEDSEDVDEDQDEEDSTDEDADTESESEARDSSVSKQSKQNHAFAEQRLQIKKNEQFIRSLGKLIGFDEGASIEQIQDRVKDALLEKEAKENGISVELARRLRILQRIF